MMKKYAFMAALAVLVPLNLTHAATVQQATTTNENIGNIVQIVCGHYDDQGAFVGEVSGSGIILDEAGMILTNAHVVTESEDENNYYFYDACFGGITAHPYEAPEFTMSLVVDSNFYRNDEFFDYALVDAFDNNGDVYQFDSAATYGNPDSLIHGDDITLVGYPAVVGSTITTTYGKVSGFEYTNWIKTDAAAEFGNSGGGAFDANGNLVGLVTSVVSGELNSYTYLQNLNAIIEDMFGADIMVRDYNTIYTTENRACLFDECYQFGEGVDNVNLADQVEETPAAPATPTVPAETPFTEAPTSTFDERFKDESLISRLTGRILLQVEQHGEAWYMHPEMRKRFYMKDGPAAYQMMRLFSLGISDADLAKIETVNSPEEMLSTASACGSNALANRLKGRILLQVEQHGEAWYIHPDKCKRIYMKDGEAAYAIMRFLSLGITDADLKKLPSDQL